MTRKRTVVFYLFQCLRVEIEVDRRPLLVHVPQLLIHLLKQPEEVGVGPANVLVDQAADVHELVLEDFLPRKRFLERLIHWRWLYL